jgi:hypothetical protein
VSNPPPFGPDPNLTGADDARRRDDLSDEPAVGGLGRVEPPGAVNGVGEVGRIIDDDPGAPIRDDLRCESRRSATTGVPQAIASIMKRPKGSPPN